MSDLPDDTGAPPPSVDDVSSGVDVPGAAGDTGPAPDTPRGTTSEGRPSDASPVGGATGGADAADDFTPEQIDALVAERDEFLAAYQRTAADFDNFRKQVQKRITDEVTRTQGAFVERLLPVLDAIDAARAQGSEHVDAVAGQLYGFLEKEGLERVDPGGEEFDPNVAEAVVHEPGDPADQHEAPVVTEVLRTGYLWNGRVIRAAMVKVAG